MEALIIDDYRNDGQPVRTTVSQAEEPTAPSIKINNASPRHEESELELDFSVDDLFTKYGPLSPITLLSFRFLEGNYFSGICDPKNRSLRYLTKI